MYINTASPTPQGLVQRFKANGIQCERVKTCIHLCIHIYMYIYIQVHKKSRHGKHLYIYLNIHTQANSCTPGKVYGRVYIYICMWTTSSKNFCTGRSTFKKCRSGYSRYGQLPLWPVVPLWLPSWRIESHRSVSMIECQGSSLKSTACAFAVLLDSL